MSVIETVALGRRYRHTWALRECSLTIPEGRVVALAGPNGAGKTTLLHLIVGLAVPTSGRVSVLGCLPAGSPDALRGIAFVAQDAPLYKNLSAADCLHLARSLNTQWDQLYAERRLAELNIPLARRVGKLSGGQQAQLALTLALARRPRLLVLDEPMARLDPLARHDFMASVMTVVAGEGLSVILSSHVVSELERVADYLVVLSAGRVQVAGEAENLLARHRILTGPATAAEDLARRLTVIYERRAGAQAHLLVRTAGPVQAVPAGWEAHPVALEELVLAYLREPGASALSGPVMLRHHEATGATA